MNRWFRPAALLVVLLLVGCGGDGLKRVPIEGVLTNMGSTPIDGATVQFIPAAGTTGEGGIGQTDAQGKFTVISSRKNDPGIPPGKYTVRVTRLINGDGTVLPANAAEADYPTSKESIPVPYSAMNSPLEATVSDQGGPIKLDIPKNIIGKGKS